MMTGCGPSEPAPTGDALYAEAEANYHRYREFVNALQSEVSTGPWEIGSLGSYGMQPEPCNNYTGYGYALNRSLQLDGEQREPHADVVEQFLRDQGMTPSRGTLGSDGQEGQLIQVAVRDEGDFKLLLVEFRKNGSIAVTTRTKCWPGDPEVLGEMLFGDVNLGMGYLPLVTEAPTDPLFFGITPGDPQFLDETPDPSATPTPTPGT